MCYLSIAPSLRRVGRAYYANDAANKSQWDRPAPIPGGVEQVASLSLYLSLSPFS